MNLTETVRSIKRTAKLWNLGKWRICLPLYILAIITMPLPLCGFILCCGYIVFDLGNSTLTECKAKNVMPSISAAISQFSQYCQAWRWAVITHTVPRLLLIYGQSRYYKNNLQRWLQFAGRITITLHLLETFSLLILTTVSSSEHYLVHILVAALFLFCAQLYVIFNSWLSWNIYNNAICQRELLILRIRRLLQIVSLFFIFLALYLFFRHDWFCEPYVYSMFSLCEYLFLLCNILCNMTIAYDLHTQNLILSLSGIYLQWTTNSLSGGII